MGRQLRDMRVMELHIMLLMLPASSSEAQSADPVEGKL